MFYKLNDCYIHQKSPMDSFVVTAFNKAKEGTLPEAPVQLGDSTRILFTAAGSPDVKLPTGEYVFPYVIVRLTDGKVGYIQSKYPGLLVDTFPLSDMPQYNSELVEYSAYFRHYIINRGWLTSPYHFYAVSTSPTETTLIISTSPEKTIPVRYPPSLSPKKQDPSPEKAFNPII